MYICFSSRFVFFVLGCIFVGLAAGLMLITVQVVSIYCKVGCIFLLNSFFS